MNQDAIIQKLQKKNAFLQKIIFRGKFDDFIYNSLSGKQPRISLIGIKGNRIEIKANIHTTIRCIKGILEKKHGVSWYRSSILQNGQILENHRTLLGLRIPSGAVLQYNVHIDSTLYPPLEQLTQRQRKDIAHDQFILREHVLRRNKVAQDNLLRMRENYYYEKRGHQNTLLMS